MEKFFFISLFLGSVLSACSSPDSSKKNTEKIPSSNPTSTYEVIRSSHEIS